jgi:hypothetical protein
MKGEATSSPMTATRDEPSKALMGFFGICCEKRLKT